MRKLWIFFPCRKPAINSHFSPKIGYFRSLVGTIIDANLHYTFFKLKKKFKNLKKIKINLKKIKNKTEKKIEKKLKKI